MKSALPLVAIGLCAVAPFGVVAGGQSPQSLLPAPTPTTPRCRIAGRVTSDNISLPGVAIVVSLGPSRRAVTSTDTDGMYSLVLAPNATYHVSVDFVGFVGTGRDLPLGTPPC